MPNWRRFADPRERGSSGLCCVGFELREVAHRGCLSCVIGRPRNKDATGNIGAV